MGRDSRGTTQISTLSRVIFSPNNGGNRHILLIRWQLQAVRPQETLTRLTPSPARLKDSGHGLVSSSSFAIIAFN